MPSEGLFEVTATYITASVIIVFLSGNICPTLSRTSDLFWVLKPVKEKLGSIYFMTVMTLVSKNIIKILPKTQLYSKKYCGWANTINRGCWDDPEY